jgi:hypothetical protein
MVCEEDLNVAAIVWARLPNHEVLGLKSIDDAGDGAVAQFQFTAEVA